MAGGAAGLGPDDRKSRAIFHFGRTRSPRSARRSRRSRAAKPSSPNFSTSLRASRDIVADGLAATGRVRFARPEAAFYLFGAVEGETDSRRLALRLVDEAGIGVAPGAAFGLGGEGYLRICFARAPDEMAEATRRLARWLAR